MARLAARIFLVVVLCWSSAAAAQIARVQRPGRKALSPEQSARVKKARAQGVSPRRMAGMTRSLDHRAKVLGEAGLDSRRFRSGLSTAPLGVRLEVFIRAAARKGITIQTFDRRLRGMLSVGKKTKVVAAKKTFFEVTPESFDLFPKIM